MSRALQVLLTWWRSLFVVVVDDQPTAAEATPEAEPTPEPRKLKATIAVTEGEFYFRGSILDQLDVYFDVLDRMRKADNNAYLLYSKIGINLVQSRTTSGANDAGVSAWWKLNRPSTGAVAFADLEYAKRFEAKSKVDHENDPKVAGLMLPRFLYFTKYEKGFAPGELEVPVLKGDVYKCTVYWDDGEKHGVPWDFGVVLGKDGSAVQVLKARSEPRRIRSKVSHKRLGVGRGGRRTVEVPVYGWEHHALFRRWAGEHNQPVEKYLAGIFIDALNSYEATQYSMIRVDVAKAGLHAAFGVNIIRTPYFFKDREVTVNVHGNKKRIFHIVRGHVRRDGAMVKTHFRGQRQFEWNGYHVKISVPFREHMSMTEFNAASLDEEAYKAQNGGSMHGTIGTRRLAKTMRQLLDNEKVTDKALRH